jgi:hypothetical protein
MNLFADPSGWVQLSLFIIILVASAPLIGLGIAWVFDGVITPSPGICPLNPLIFYRRRKDSNPRSQCPARKIGDVGHRHE